MEYLIAIVPSVAAGVVLYFVLRWINRADRTERAVQREMHDDAARWYESVKGSKGSRNPFGIDEDKQSKTDRNS